MIKVDKALEEYHQMTSARLKASSIFIQSYYVKHLTECFHTLKIKKFSQINHDTGYLIISWYRNNTKCKNNSINKNLRYLKAVMGHYEVKSSFLKFKLLKSDTVPYKRLFHDDLKLIINYVDQMNYSANSIVYRAVIYLLLDSGCRISELLNIKIRNIDFENKRIYLEITKNGKVRYAPFSNFSCDLIKEYIAIYPQRTYLFYNILRNRELNKSDIKNFYKRLKKWCDLDRIHSHRLRKTFGSILSENGMPIESIQTLFDHSRISTTMIYVEHKKEKALEDFDKYANWKVA